jgi:hypothetical protein
MGAPISNSLSFADIYGQAAPGRSTGTAPSDEQVASGNVSAVSGSQPAFSLLGMVIALVILRVAFQLAKEV